MGSRQQRYFKCQHSQRAGDKQWSHSIFDYNVIWLHCSLGGQACAGIICLTRHMMSFPEEVLRNQNCDRDLITKLILYYRLSTDKHDGAQFVLKLHPSIECFVLVRSTMFTQVVLLFSFSKLNLMSISNKLQWKWKAATCWYIMTAPPDHLQASSYPISTSGTQQHTLLSPLSHSSDAFWNNATLREKKV